MVSIYFKSDLYASFLSTNKKIFGKFNFFALIMQIKLQKHKKL